MSCLHKIILACWIGFCCAASSAVFCAETSTRLPPAISEALNQAGIPESSVGIYVRDVQSARPLLAFGDERPLNPASTIKLLTTFAALDQLGPAYQWTTQAFADGTMTGEVLNGDLILKGGGDPRLTLENFWLMLRALRARGLREIRGDLVLDRSYFAVDEINPGDFDNEPTRPYNTAPDALLVNFKSIRLQFVPDAERQTLKILVEPPLAPVQVLNNVVLDNERCDDWLARIKLTALGDRTGARLLFSGSYSTACGEKERNYSVLGHAQYVHALFTHLWRELGGVFAGGVRDGPVPAAARPLLGYQTQSLAEVVRDINKFSNNVMARELYLSLGAVALGAPATYDKGERAIRQWLAARGLSVPGLALENGSGLSRTERITARGMGQLLLAAFESPVMPEFIASMPLVAVDGTMKKRLNATAVAGQAHIKTGSLTGVRAIAGYVLDAKGRSVVVVCLINHANTRNASAVQDALVRWIYDK